MKRFFFLSLMLCGSFLFIAADDGSVGVLESGSMVAVEEKGKLVLFHCTYDMTWDPNYSGILGNGLMRTNFIPSVGRYYEHYTPMSAMSYAMGVVLASGRDASKPLLLELTSNVSGIVPSASFSGYNSYSYDGDDVTVQYDAHVNNSYGRMDVASGAKNQRFSLKIEMKVYQEFELESIENGYVNANNQYRQGVDVFVLDGGIWKPAAGAYIHDATGAPRRWFGEVK